MSSEPGFLFQFVQIAGSVLVAAAYVFGLVCTLRRWHVGFGARLAALGFLIELITLIGALLFYALRIYVPRSLFGSQDAIFWEYTVIGAMTSLLNVTALALIILGIRSMLQEISRLRTEPHPLRESDLR